MRRATMFGVDTIPIADISIHALHEESDNLPERVGGELRISIHALHEESDSKQPCSPTRRLNFNPRSP